VTTALMVGVFGVAGSLLRFAIDTWFAHRSGTRRHWPWATLLVNVAGSLVIGLSVGLSGRLGLSEEWHAAIATGLAGGLTTFSSWTTATIRLVSEGRYRAASLNLVINLAAGLAAAGVGIALAG
jgi:fluoride exporter